MNTPTDSNRDGNDVAADGTRAAAEVPPGGDSTGQPADETALAAPGQEPSQSLGFIKEASKQSYLSYMANELSKSRSQAAPNFAGLVRLPPGQSKNSDELYGVRIDAVNDAVTLRLCWLPKKDGGAGWEDVRSGKVLRNIVMRILEAGLDARATDDIVRLIDERLRDGN